MTQAPPTSPFLERVAAIRALLPQAGSAGTSGGSPAAAEAAKGNPGEDVLPADDAGEGADAPPPGDPTDDEDEDEDESEEPPPADEAGKANKDDAAGDDEQTVQIVQATELGAYIAEQVQIGVAEGLKALDGRLGRVEESLKALTGDEADNATGVSLHARLAGIEEAVLVSAQMGAEAAKAVGALQTQPAASPARPGGAVSTTLGRVGVTAPNPAASRMLPTSVPSAPAGGPDEAAKAFDDPNTYSCLVARDYATPAQAAFRKQHGRWPVDSGLTDEAAKSVLDGSDEAAKAAKP